MHWCCSKVSQWERSTPGLFYTLEENRKTIGGGEHRSSCLLHFNVEIGILAKCVDGFPNGVLVETCCIQVHS